MNKTQLGHIMRGAKRYLTQHSPEILTGIGITGMIATTVLAVKETPKALRRIEDAQYDKGDFLTPKEKLQACWKCYVPATVTGVTSIACLIGATSVNARRTAALAAAYQISETALAEYKEKVIETIGEKREQVVREKVAQEQLDQNPVSKTEIYVTGKGETLFWDYISKRYFKFDIDKLRKIENQLNKQMIHDICGYISLNEFYDEIGLERVEYGYEMGWNAYNDIDLYIYPGMTDEEEPCLVLSHHNAPKYGYDK